MKGFYRGVAMIPLESVMVGLMFTLFDKIFTDMKNVEDLNI
jgi:hypothetical protein